MKAKHVKPFPFPVYFWVVAVVTAAGLANSLYLAISHYRVHTDILYSSFCAVSQSINCDTVSQSPYSIFLNVPVPVWGIIGYAIFIVLLFFANTKRADKIRMWPLLFVITLGFSLYSIILAYISRYYIGAYCIMCILGYGINFGLLYFTWLIRRRFPEKSFLNEIKNDVLFLLHYKRTLICFFLPFLTVVLLLPIYFPNYWKFELPDLSTDIATGVTEKGCPWIGAEDPELVISEYTDYMCFQCKKTHAYLRQIVERNSDTIRLVHRHFPMDRKFNPLVTSRFHPGAGKLAIAAAYATLEGRFWQMNDLLYDVPRGIKTLDIQELADKSGVNAKWLALAPKNKAVRYKVKHDIAMGIKLGITGTPAYVIDGNVYQGHIPVKVIKGSLETYKGVTKDLDS